MIYYDTLQYDMTITLYIITHYVTMLYHKHNTV